MAGDYAETEPTLAEIEALDGATLLEFGTNWCGWCRRAQPLIAGALAQRPVRHLKIGDSKAKRLGRAYKVKLWPTLVFLKDGKEAGKLVRPAAAEEILRELEKL